MKERGNIPKTMAEPIKTKQNEDLGHCSEVKGGHYDVFIGGSCRARVRDNVVELIFEGAGVGDLEEVKGSIDGMMVEFSISLRRGIAPDQMDIVEAFEKSWNRKVLEI